MLSLSQKHFSHGYVSGLLGPREQKSHQAVLFQNGRGSRLIKDPFESVDRSLKELQCRDYYITCVKSGN